MISQGYSLTELSEFMGVQNVAQFGLAYQNNLQQLFFAGFQVRQQPQLLQDISAQILGLVNEKDNLFALGFLTHQKDIQFVYQFFGVIRIIFNAQFVVNGFNQLLGTQSGIENIGRDGVFFQVFKKSPA